jgi:hypothetical protein
VRAALRQSQKKQARLCQAWIRNHKRLKRLLRETRVDKLLAAFFHVAREKGIEHGDFRQRREDRSRNTKQDACF